MTSHKVLSNELFYFVLVATCSICLADLAELATVLVVMAGNRHEGHNHSCSLESDVSQPSSLADSVQTGDSSNDDFAVSPLKQFLFLTLHSYVALLLSALSLAHACH